MKPVCLLLPVYLLFASCAVDDIDYGLDAYEEQLAEVRMVSGKPAFLLDDGRLLYNAGTKISSELRDSARVHISYSLLPDHTSGFDRTIRVNWIRNIGFRELQAIDAATINKIPDDPAHFESAWIGRYYLNLIFNIEYKSQPHKIYLVTDSAKLNDERIPIYFRHDKNNDSEGYKNNIITSFSLEKLLGPPSGKKKLHLNVNSVHYGNKTYEIVY